MSSAKRRRRELASAVATNLLPLVGVAFWGWSIAALVLLYWLELGSLLWWSTVRAVFAQRPSENFGDQLLLGATRYKRGGPSIPRTNLTIQVQHLPILTLTLPVLVLIWLFAGALSIGAIDASAATNGLETERATLTLGLGAVGIFVGNGLSTVSKYFFGREYEEVNAQMALKTVMSPMMVLTLVLFFTVGIVSAGVTGGVLVVAIVGVKFFFDLVNVYRDRLRAFDERDAIEFGWAYDPPEWPEVDSELSEPVETVRPKVLAVLANGPFHGLVRPAPAFFLGIFLLGSLAMVALGALEAALLFATAFAIVFCVFSLAGVADESIRHLTMEYRVAGDVVGYDRLLGESQWRVSERELAAAEREASHIDRLLGTETLVVERDDRTIRLVHLADADAVRPETG